MVELLGAAGRDGVDVAMDRLDRSNVSPRQLYHIILGRPPENSQQALPGPQFEALRAARFMLRSPEFDQHVVPKLLQAFPEKRRLLVVHIEKCAGTDLQEHLRQFYPVLRPHGMPFHEVAAAMHRRADTFVVGGHVGILWYLLNRLYRHHDRMITVVRHPQDLMLSHANYVIRRIKEAPRAPDCVRWLQEIGMDAPKGDLRDNEWREIAVRVLEKVTGRNVLCRYLSGNGTAAGAFELLARVDIEISDMDHYEPWLLENWGITSSRRLNNSPALLRREHLGAVASALLDDNSAEDMRLFERIASAIRAGGGNSVTGPRVWSGG